MRTHSSSPRARSACLAVLVALAASLMSAAGAAAAQASPAPVPCTPASGGQHDCTFYPAGDGISAGAPVVNAAGTKVGYLNHGTNFVLCEAYGAREGTATTYNHWWAWTEANDGSYGWVSAYYAQGGDNDGPFQGVPDCAGAHGAPPGGSAAAPSSEVPCSAIGGGRFDCDFYPAGNGASGGTPVRAADGSLVGYLHQGENYVFCQSTGEEIGSSTVYNNTWAYTQADDDRYGWVNAYYARGGANNGAFQNVPQCGAAHGYPPGGAPAPKPAPGPSGPTPATCRHTAASQYTCDFYPPGDGLSGGAPVEAANQQGVGYLNHGKNWIICQQTGGEVTVGSDHNDWWGRTEADDGSWGWVNAVYASDGANDGPFSGVPHCNGADGATPQGPVVAPPSGGSGGSGGGGGGTTPPGSGGAPNEIPPVYVPMYQASSRQYGVNWLLIASIHAQETNFSRSGLPGVRSGLNGAGCCAGPTQFSVIPSADTWATYRNAFAPISGARPAHYPLQSGVTVCGSRGGHPCVYDDFDAISATGSYLHADGAGENLAAGSTYQAVKNYGASSDYANEVIQRAENWQAGTGGSSHFANQLFRSPAITVSSETSRTVTAAAARHHPRHQPKLAVRVTYRHSAAAARRAFRAFIRAYRYARPGVTYTVHYRHLRRRSHR